MQTTYTLANGAVLATDTDNGGTAVLAIRTPCGKTAATIIEQDEAVRFALAVLAAFTPFEAETLSERRLRINVGEGRFHGTATTPLHEDGAQWHLNTAVASLAACANFHVREENAAGEQLDAEALDLARAHSGNEELTLLDLAEHEVESWRDVARYAQKLPDALKV